MTQEEMAWGYRLLVSHLKAHYRDGGFIIPKPNAKIFRDAIGKVDMTDYDDRAGKSLLKELIDINIKDKHELDISKNQS